MLYQYELIKLKFLINEFDIINTIIYIIKK